jgi:hypothetical protein
MCSRIRADARKRFAECDYVFVLGALADFAKARVISVLLAPFGVPTGRLNVSVRKRTDPHIRPGRWNGERFHAPEHVALGQPGTIGASVGETLP